VAALPQSCIPNGFSIKLKSMSMNASAITPMIRDARAFSMKRPNLVFALGIMA
jgi:hypothetical protein